MNKKFKKILIGIITIIVLGIIAYPKIFTNNEVQTNNPGGSGGGGLNVAVFITQPEPLSDKIFTNGTTSAEEEVEVRSEISGRISKIYFKEGSRVKKGDLLVKINDAEILAQLNRAKYRLKLAEDKEFRQRELLKKEAISQQDYDVALNEFNTLKADVDFYKAQIEKTEITAPFNGVIGLRFVSEGSYITPTNIISNLQNISTIKIDFSVPERYSSKIKTGSEVNFRVQGQSRTFTARVYAIEPKIDQVTRTLLLRATFNNSQNLIFPGMFAEIDFILEEIENAIMIPTESIVPELQGQKVFIVKNGRAASVSVEIGIRTSQKVQIINGLNVKDTVLVSGLLQVRDGLPLKISEIK